MKNLPDKIYLQIGEDINIDSSIDFNCLSEVTWCEDKINDNDIVYIRADQQQLSEETRKEYKKCNHSWVELKSPVLAWKCKKCGQIKC